MTAPVSRQPSPLMEYLLAVLSPLLAVGSVTDLHLARLAAAEAIAACQAHGGQDLMAAGQIVGLGVAMLDDLRLSAPPEVSVSLKLKLRGNAAALNRAGQAMTAALRRLQRDGPRSPPPDAAREARAREAARAALAAARVAVRQAEEQATAVAPLPGSPAIARTTATDDDRNPATTGMAAPSATAN